MTKDYSFIILTFNEAGHLPRLLRSIEALRAPVFVLDSGSSDDTVAIAERFGATVAHHPFENHPRQWAEALRRFAVTTPWTIALDADQEVLPELYALLDAFRDAAVPAGVDGIYFNRKNYFQGRWLRHGGYFPKYLLKMFRTGKGYSDLEENMDHRFVVPGRTIIWTSGYLKEENLKENDIAFWIAKHNRYSDLVADEEIGRRRRRRAQTVRPRLLGNPDERVAFFKRVWWGLPLYWRPVFYFIYRFVIRLGFLDGRAGRLFHFLHAFWFRLIVDEKIRERLKRSE